MPSGPAWTSAEISILKANQTLSDELIAAELGRSWSAVKNMRQKLGLPKKRGRKPLNSEKAVVRPCVRFSATDLEFILDTMDKPIGEIAVAMGRSVSSVQNARIRVKRANGLHVREQGHKVPKQDLWERPPGTYVEVIGTILMEDPEIMEHWMHAHGYTSFKNATEDNMGWTTILCTKET